MPASLATAEIALGGRAGPGRSRSQKCFQNGAMCESGCVTGRPSTTRCSACSVEREQEGHQVGDVVDDVVRDHDVGAHRQRRDLRPLAEHRGDACADPRARLEEPAAHLLAVWSTPVRVDAGGSERDGRASAAAADVEHAAARRDGLARSTVRG